MTTPLALSGLLLIVLCACKPAAPAPARPELLDQLIDTASRTPGRYAASPFDSTTILLTDTTTGELWIFFTTHPSNGWNRVAGPVLEPRKAP